MTLFPFWHYNARCKVKVKNVRNLTFSFVAYSFVFSFWLSCFHLIKSFHQNIYVCVEEHVFLFHMHASAECLLGLVVEGNIHWGHEVESVISLMVYHNNLGWNTAADLWDFLHDNIDCLISQASVGYSESVLYLLIRFVSASTNWLLFKSSSN